MCSLLPAPSKVVPGLGLPPQGEVRLGHVLPLELMFPEAQHGWSPSSTPSGSPGRSLLRVGFRAHGSEVSRSGLQYAVTEGLGWRMAIFQVAKGPALDILRRGTGVSPVLPTARMAVPQTRTKFTFWGTQRINAPARLRRPLL
jgi:hypothetical protein